MGHVPVVDLHCDLLCFLQMKAERTPFDPLSRGSFAQMKEGGVRLQALPVFTYTKAGSTKSGQEQIEIFTQLPYRYDAHYAFFTGPECFAQPTDKIYVTAAFENASGFCEEDEPLERGLSRLQHFYEMLKRILYISMTWDSENRFGGGNASKVGLKEDGKQLLRWMHGKQIAIDFSHTSDALAFDILNFIDQNKLKIPVIASHSNFRSITNVARNLPDELAQEIIRRGGIIGFNLFSPFIGPQDPYNLLKHVEHGLKLKGENALCFGADFFNDDDFPGAKTKYKSDLLFFEEYGNASTYPRMLHLFEQKLGLPAPLVQAVASQNSLNFLKNTWN